MRSLCLFFVLLMLSCLFSYGTDRADPLNYCVIVETDSGKGSGFVCDIDGTNYLVTNTHVIEGAKEFSFKLLNGKKLSPVSLALADDRDLARILIKEQESSACIMSDDSVRIGESVFVYGNSLGMNAVTLQKGKVQGIGADVIETSAAFVEGNSGSPLINADGDLIGVATYVTRSDAHNWVNQGTRFTKTRRFAVRLNSDVKWVQVSVKKLYDDSTALADVDAFLGDAWKTMMAFKLLGSNRRIHVSKALSFFKENTGDSLEGKYNDKEYPRQIKSLSKNILKVLEKIEKGHNPRSSAIRAPLRNIEYRFSNLTSLPEEKLRSIRWSTGFFKGRADKYLEIVRRWEEAGGSN